MAKINSFHALELAGSEDDFVELLRSSALQGKKNKRKNAKVKNNIVNKATIENEIVEKMIEVSVQEIDGKRTTLMRPLVWIDLEMTGLDVEKDRILEIACIITDGQLNHEIEGPHYVIHEPEEALAAMNDWCQEHHTQSGLVEKVRNSSTLLADAEQKMVEFLDKHIQTDSRLAQLAGNSVYVDFLFLKKHMPELATRFHHVLVDVSSIKSVCQRWYPEKEVRKMPLKTNSHRALEDIKESIEELKHLRKLFFKVS